MSSGIWFTFGSDSNGRTDVANSEDSTLFTVESLDLAEKIVKLHNAALWDREKHLIVRYERQATITGACGSCRFYDGVSECRRYAPTTPSEGNHFARWPKVVASGSCGEWRAKA